MNEHSDILNSVIVDQRRGLPLHLQVQRALRTMIDEHFEDGEPFFTESMLVERLKVSRATVRQALGELSREGIIVRRAAKGSVVTKRCAADPHSRDSVPRTSTVGVFVSQYDSEYMSSLLEGIAGACRQRDMNLQIYHTHKGEDVAKAYRCVQRPPDEERLLLISAQELYDPLNDRGYRTVAFEKFRTDYPGVVVETDSTMAVYIGVDYLRTLGHSRIALLVNEPAVVLSVVEKMAAFEQIATSRGLDPGSRIWRCGTQLWQSSYDAAYANMDRFWAESAPNYPTAIFTVSDPGGWAVLKWLAAHGLRVPEDISVLGFEGTRTSEFTQPGLSTVAHPIGDLVKSAMDALWSDTPRSARLAPSLVIRESAGPAPSLSR
ncbi:MAG: GntR family transcriptional regulator [Capsulimonadaceae bacterium]|nr:GntR family transcriptional regulator [Capsulimonadaceae bacterium]